MSVAKITEISSSSSKSYEDAIETGIARADKTLNGIKSAWVKDHQVSIKGGKVTEHRVVLKITFVLD
ncbi:MAG: dodecin family protein [Gammaproteobacteria bacterium]